LPVSDLSLTVPLPVFREAEGVDPIQFGTGPVGPLTTIGLRWGGFGIGGNIADAQHGDVVGEIPIGTIDVEDVDITLPLDLSAGFQIALVWHSNRLRLKITRGSQVRYHSL
jgi:hypothetical protein